MTMIAAVMQMPSVAEAPPTGYLISGGYSRANDPFLDRTVSQLGVGLGAYNDLLTDFHGYAIVEMYKGGDGGKYELIGNLNIVLLMSPKGSEPGLRPFIGSGAGIGGGSRWSGLLAAGINWNPPRRFSRPDGTPLSLQTEWAFAPKRLYVRLAITFDQ